MSLMIILMAVGIALVLLFVFVMAAQSKSPSPVNTDHSIDWFVIQDAELQSYLPDRKISAIKRYRELSDVGLKEAKEVIEYVIANPDNKGFKGTTVADTGGAGVRDLILEGRIEDAVDVYAAFMGVDEFTARDAIQGMERDINAETNLSDGNFDSVRELLTNGKKIQAIKEYRLLTGTGLADAKRAVEDLD